MIKDAEEFVRLRCSEDPEEYRRAAQEPADIKVWLDIIALYPEMRKWVAHNKTISSHVLDILAKDTDPSVRSMIARRRNAGEEILSLLSEDKEESVRRAVLFNPKSTPTILLKLMRDKVKEIAEIAQRKFKEIEGR